MPQARFEYKNLIGVSKSKDLSRIPPGYLLNALNVDSDDSKKLHRRRGRALIDDESTHSFWSNKTSALCVQGGVLKEVIINLNTMIPTYTTLLSGAGNTPMIFQDVADMVFFSNSNVFGYISEHVVHGIPEVTQTFKKRMIGGHLMEYWDSRLWVFQDSILTYSDAAMPMVRDERHNFVSFNGRGKMLKAVSDGLYISDTECCAFLQGGEGDPPKFKFTTVANSPCIEGMAISIEGEDIGEGISGKVVLWATSEGCFLGLPQGITKKLTGRNFNIEGVSRGVAMFITRKLASSNARWRQYLGVYDLEPGYGGMKFDLDIPAIQIHGHITQITQN